MAEKVLAIIASTINGAIQEFPQTIYIPCNKAVGEGEQIIRDFDINFCVVAKKVFLVRYNEDVYGTTQFRTIKQFRDYQYSQCLCCANCCYILYAGCYITFGGVKISFGTNR